MEQPEVAYSTDIEKEIVVAASPDVVFAHFTDPERACRWMGICADLDPRPGGIYRVDINGRDIARGEYVEVVPYSRVVFTWGWEATENPLRPGASTVEITLVPREDGATVVRLRHSGLPEPSREPHSKGWDHYLERLRIAVEGGDPGPDPQM